MYQEVRYADSDLNYLQKTTKTVVIVMFFLNFLEKAAKFFMWNSAQQNCDITTVIM